MDIKREDPSKVIIVPRPPRQMNPDLVPLEPADVVEPEAAEEAEEVAQAEAEASEMIAPEISPMNNQVEGPGQGLAGIAKRGK